MDGKRNDFIEGNDFVLYGEKVIVSPLNQSNIEGYLSTYKRASAFAEIYERMPDFWEKQRQWIEDCTTGGRNDID